MRTRRMRGLGCLGCLPVGGLITLLLPIILIGALIYYLVNRQKTNPSPGPYTPPSPGGGFCSRCGKPVAAGTRFCANCGHPMDQS